MQQLQNMNLSTMQLFCRPLLYVTAKVLIQFQAVVKVCFLEPELYLTHWDDIISM